MLRLDQVLVVVVFEVFGGERLHFEESSSPPLVDSAAHRTILATEALLVVVLDVNGITIPLVIVPFRETFLKKLFQLVIDCHEIGIFITF